ncbi:hypothetical protein DNH61_05490 [Paenibacillus sambharensis]|uniref:DUF3784 domain-containing protein n=1 Tax=Paenibacillus sambharensis TaxID=1803190 RepID=A0A2W1L8Z3_9BACL|nr:hypothetical protein [Paenibacillus sambharensis]PZD96658.1 hypothetical protein DNH61_05490 [Paenibacillus sambharensis]
MAEKIIVSLSVFVFFIIGGGLGVKFPEIRYKISGINNQNKKPIKSEIKRYIIGSYIMIIIGIIVIIVTWLDGFNIPR